MLGMKTMVEKWLNRFGGRAEGIIEGEVVRDGSAGAGTGEAAAQPAARDGGRGARAPDPIVIPVAAFNLGEVVRHRFFPFRGVIFDVDPEFANTEEWWEAIPEAVRPRKDQPFYHLLAENEDSAYVAYVSQQNLLADDSGLPIHHPAVAQIFDRGADGRYVLKRSQAN
jgi:heat shock protein HspQ